MKNKTLALNLLELRHSKKLTQKQLCEALHIGRSTYSYFETGSRTPDIDTLLLIANYYQVSLDDLVASGINSPVSEINTNTVSDIPVIYHLKSRHIPIDAVLELSKADFDFLSNYKKLTDDNKAELQYLMNYKLRKQSE